MPAAVQSYLAAVGPAAKIYAVGGQADAALASVGYTPGGGAKPYTRLVGSDRYQSSQRAGGVRPQLMAVA